MSVGMVFSRLYNRPLNCKSKKIVWSVRAIAIACYLLAAGFFWKWDLLTAFVTTLPIFVLWLWWIGQRMREYEST